jgi:hypothetical protein
MTVTHAPHSLLALFLAAGLAIGCRGPTEAPRDDGDAEQALDAGPSGRDASVGDASTNGGPSASDSGAPHTERDAGAADGGEPGFADAGSETDAGLPNQRGSELGVNYNGRTRLYDKDDLARIGTTWVRAFIDVTSLQRAGEAAILTNPDIVGFRRMRADGYKVILNLKYNYRSDEGVDLDFPSDANSQAFKDIRAFTTKLLDSVFAETDVIVVGNEPFIEADASDRDEDLVLFYKHMANHVITYNKAHGNIPLYVGAFNNLHNPTWRTQATQDLIAYARNTPGVTGIDLHLHAGSVAEMREAILWAKGELGEKRLISTEFSLIQYFKQHLDNLVPASFAQQYGIDESWQVHQYLNYAVHTPRPRQEWVDFLKASPWFLQVQMSLTNADIAFDELGLSVATYALLQTQTNIGPTTDPWLLNGIYCNQTCESEPATMDKAFSYPWSDSFQARQ